MQSKDFYKRLEALGVNLVHLDVTRHANVDQLVDVSKVSRKDKPTFLLRADDGLHKIPSQAVNENFPDDLKSEIDRLSTTKLIWSMKDLSDALKKNNTKLDSLTVVYVHDDSTYKDD
jgi:hypothetical protein